MRLEKGYGSWGREYTTEYNPYESRLDRFVKLDKGQFVGRDHLAKIHNETPRWLLSCFTVDVDDQDAVGGEPILCDGQVVGIVSSGAFGHTVGNSIALGFIPPDRLDSDRFTIEIIGKPRAAQVVSESLVDPKGIRMRS